MNIDDVVVVGGPLVLVSAEEVDALESRLWIKFPSGYHDYMQRLGEGVLGGLVRIYPPAQIENQLVEWRRRIHKYWFWDKTLELLPKERALECVIIGDTGNGDELIFHPCRPGRIYLLPIGRDGAMEAGSDLLEAISWMCSPEQPWMGDSEELVEPFPNPKFEPYDSHHIARERAAGEAKTVVDPEGESLDDIIELGRRWVERHAARETHSDKLKSVAGNGTTAKLTFEAIVLTGDESLDLMLKEGYRATYSIFDDQSGSRVGEFRIIHSGDSTSYSPYLRNSPKDS